MVHGDDFTFTGKRRYLFEIKRKLEESYELKMRAMLGVETEDDKEIALLDRTLIWTNRSITFEADPKHVREILSYQKCDSTSKGLHVPIVKETKEELAEGEVGLEPRVVAEFRGLAARASYLSLDRPGIQFATKEICRGMDTLTERGMQKMKRLARYLLHPSNYFRM